MSVHIGTSGWSYAHWDGVLYPHGLPARERLGVYASTFGSVELNASFYRWPPDRTFASWRRRLPAGFVMSAKAPRGLTHAKRLYAPEVWATRLAAGWHELGDRRGVLLVQLAPDHIRDDRRLDHFLGCLPDWMDVAVELRHDSWVDDAVFDILERHGAAYCVMSGAGLPCVLRATAPFVYVRLHGPSHDHLYAGSYSDADLRWWATRLEEWDRAGLDVHAFFNNDGHGHAVRNAATLSTHVDELRALGLGAETPPEVPALAILGGRAGEWHRTEESAMSIKVNVDNFCRAETDRMIAGLLARTDGLGTWHHDRALSPLDEQTVIRQNRDTLYSLAIVDITDGITLTVPDAGSRYLSVMVVNQDHYINRVIHDPGDHLLTMDEFDTRYLVLAARILVDPADPADLAVVHGLQDQFAVRGSPATPFVMPDYDDASLTATRRALLELARGISGFDHAFGTIEHVDPVRHLIGTAAGWGGLPEQEAFYINVEPNLPVGEYQLTVGDVPADAFWSISLYNADGFFEPNERNVNNINSVTATRNEEGTITVSFGGCGEHRPNCLPIIEGWNYLVRLYRPRPEVLDGSWTFPSLDGAPSRGSASD